MADSSRNDLDCISIGFIRTGVSPMAGSSGNDSDRISIGKDSDRISIRSMWMAGSSRNDLDCVSIGFFRTGVSPMDGSSGNDSDRILIGKDSESISIENNFDRISIGVPGPERYHSAYRVHAGQE